MTYNSWEQFLKRHCRRRTINGFPFLQNKHTCGFYYDFSNLIYNFACLGFFNKSCISKAAAEIMNVTNSMLSVCQENTEILRDIMWINAIGRFFFLWTKFRCFYPQTLKQTIKKKPKTNTTNQKNQPKRTVVQTNCYIFFLLYSQILLMLMTACI